MDDGRPRHGSIPEQRAVLARGATSPTERFDGVRAVRRVPRIENALGRIQSRDDPRHEETAQEPSRDPA